MEIDVDDILQYPEDDLFPQDNFENPGEDERRNRSRGNSSPQAKRRNVPSSEFVNKIVHLDESALDPSLDWYLRIDLGGEKSASEPSERDRKLDNILRQVQKAKEELLEDGNCLNKGEDSNRTKDEGKILTFPPRFTSQWMPVTTPMDRTRLYVTLRPAVTSLDKKMEEKRNNRNLLGQDFEEILEKAEKLNKAKMAVGEIIGASSKPPVPDTCTIYFTEPMDSESITTTHDGTSEKKTIDSTLWVDKYKARGYIDLLSDDGVNRTLLTWLKLWDECVFGRKTNRAPNTKRFTGPAVFKERIFNKFGSHGSSPFKKSGPNVINADTLPTTLDAHKRPVHKIALLSGTPGVGKTTLAHIVARHAGYYVQEMNASDDRNLEAFRKQIEGATQMQATLDGNRRPHCLIIDEIDGAPAPSINYLVSLTSVVEENSTDQSKTLPGKKRIGGAFVLRRPIICICNDLYAPSLRELRKIALVLQVPPIEQARLADRLNQISFRESVKAEPGCFELMSTKSGFDVRSCINSLQLLTFSDSTAENGPKNETEKRLTLQRVMTADVGGKDVQRSLFSTWQEIFQLPKTQKRSAQNETSGSSLSTRVNNVLRACEQCGEEDRLHAGLFENYLLVDFRDPRLESICTGIEWLGFVDQLDRVVGESQLFELKRYAVRVSAVFHLLFANRQYTKLVYPQMLQEINFKNSRSQSTLQSMMNDVKSTIRSFINCTVLITDILPLVLEIIQPHLRSVNVQLYSAHEKILFYRVVDIMRDYNLTYRQQRSMHGQYEFVLEPPVEEIVYITESSAGAENSEKKSIVFAHKSQLSHSVKQAISREIELGKMRNKEPKESGDAGKSKESKLPSKSSTPSDSKEPNQKKFSFKTGLFGNLKVPDDGSDSAVENSTKEGRIWFKYHEGCNNAIRRYLKISDLL